MMEVVVFKYLDTNYFLGATSIQPLNIREFPLRLSRVVLDLQKVFGFGIIETEYYITRWLINKNCLFSVDAYFDREIVIDKNEANNL